MTKGELRRQKKIWRHRALRAEAQLKILYRRCAMLEGKVADANLEASWANEANAHHARQRQDRAIWANGGGG